MNDEKPLNIDDKQFLREMEKMRPKEIKRTETPPRNPLLGTLIKLRRMDLEGKEEQKRKEEEANRTMKAAEERELRKSLRKQRRKGFSRQGSEQHSPLTGPALRLG